MATLAELLRQGADKLINLPTEAQRFVTNPQAFTQLLTGKNPLPRETGFAAGATGLPPTEMSVLDPNQAAYMQGYSQGEPIGYAGMAAPFAAPAAVATGKALAPKLGQVTENYMVRQGMIQPLTAYHGTPHTIQGQFDINKVGTGEGAQAYGHGMYFAENPNVAKDYQKKLSESELIYEGKPLEDQYDALRQKYGNVTGSFLEYAADNGITDARNLIANYLKNPAEKTNFGDVFIQNATNKQLEKALNDLNDVERLSKGNLYKVDIPDADIPMMLDWDKTLLQQTPQVQEALAKLGIKTDKQKLSQFDDALLDALMNDANKPLPKQPINPTGQDIYQTFVQGNPQLTSQKLNEAGIRGIRYLDEGSRAKGKGTSNFVVFDPSTVKILEKNDQPVSQNSLQSVIEPIRDRGLTIDASESKKAPIITLSRIEVPKDMRSTGMGTQALQELAQYADQSKKTIALSPSKDFGASSVNRLKDFYKRFGFVENKGRNKDFSISESMYRLPTQPTRKELIQQQIDKIE